MTAFITILGFIGAACFALCTAPQILRVLKRKSTADISLLFILLSLGGNLCSATYIFYTNWISGYWQIPQYFNYTIATMLVVTLLCLKIKYDRGPKKETFSSSISEIKRKYCNWKYDLHQNREKVWTACLLGIMFVGTIIYLCLT